MGFHVSITNAQSSFKELSFKSIADDSHATAVTPNQFISTSNFLDAALNSLNSLNSLVKKENYRNKITSFNNPTSSDMGFNLENEIQTALKPLLAKAHNTNANKFSQIVSSLVAVPKSTTTLAKNTSIINPIFPTLLSLVGNLAINEKKITRQDMDSFILVTSKYFVQYEKLNQANNLFDQNIDRLNNKLAELQFDMREYMLDMITILYKNMQRSSLKNLPPEELFLKYMDQQLLMEKFSAEDFSRLTFPSDGIKSAKDIANNIQKLFNDYQKVYNENYQQIKMILNETKGLGKNINVRQVDASVKDLELLYNDSKTSDAMALRLNTLFERLKALTGTEQVVKK